MSEGAVLFRPTDLNSSTIKNRAETALVRAHFVGDNIYTANAFTSSRSTLASFYRASANIKPILKS